MTHAEQAILCASVVICVVGCSQREGDFNITMPPAALGQPAGEETATESFRLEMRAHDDGSLRTMRLDEAPLGVEMTTPDERRAAFDRLRQELIQRLGDRDNADNAELVFVADDNLDYEYIITAIAKVAPADDGVSLIDKIKFETSP